MVGIIRREPLGELFDDFFRGFLVRPVGYEENAERGIRLDVTEQPGTYRVQAELPGAKKEDIQVQIDGDQVTIGAEVRGESDSKEGERFVHKERYFGKYSRSFRLNQEIDQERAVAKFDNGVLELTLPKKTAAPAGRLNIQ
jgi:HSP20 family protein